MKRPMLYWVSLFILGEVLSRILPISMAALCIIGIVPVYAIPMFTKRYSHYIKKNITVFILGILFFLLGAVCTYNMQIQIKQCSLEDGTEIYFTGKITGEEISKQGTAYLVALEKYSVYPAGKEQKYFPLSIKVRLFLGEQEEFVLGSRIKGAGKVKSFSHAVNPGGYDEKSYQNGKGIFLNLQGMRVEPIVCPKVSARAFLYSIKYRLIKVYWDILEEKNASLAVAMVLGEKAFLDTDIKELYQKNGIAHLIAISGLHIAMIGGTIYQIFRKILGSYMISASIGMSFIILYGVMTGLSGATTRAVIMLVISIGAEVCGRRYDTITAIALALFVMLLNNPYQITQAGFLLSFGAVVGIAVVNPVWKYLWPGIPRYIEGLLVSISVQLVLIPVMLYYFYEIPLYGVLLNIIVVPLMGVLLPVLIISGLLGCIWLPGARIAVLPGRFIFGLYEWLCNVSERFPFHRICTGRPDVWWIAAYYITLVLFLAVAYGGLSLWDVEKQGQKIILAETYRKIILIGTGFIYSLLFMVFLLPTVLTFCIFDVGQGDGIYIRTPYRHHILIDGGSSSKQKIGAYVLKSGILYYGGDKLDYVFLSHSDSDHYSGIEELLEDGSIDIDNFVLPAISNPDEAYYRLEQKALEKGCKIYYMKRGDILQIDNVVFRCLNPEEAEYTDKNTGSLVLQLSYGDFDALLTGDIDKSAEQSILDSMSVSGNAEQQLAENNMQHRPQGTVEFLKVAHHGSATSTSESFLKVLHPQVACVSVGENNRYGHPAKEVMERLSRFVKKIYLTKDSGAITIDTDGKTYRIKTFLEE